MLLHNAQELDNNLRARSNEDLALAGLLGIVDGVERIVQNAGFDHCCDVRLWELWLGIAVVEAEILSS